MTFLLWINLLTNVPEAHEPVVEVVANPIFY